MNGSNEMSGTSDSFRNMVGIKDVLNVLGEVLAFVFRASTKVRGKILARHSMAMTLTDDHAMNWVNAKLEGGQSRGANEGMRLMQDWPQGLSLWDVL